MILSGTGTQVRDTFNFMVKFEDKIKQYVLSHSKITEEEYKKMDRTEWYMSAEDMIQHGLIDEIV
jgi:ATP-dependent protease ClpP protease subunit